MTKKAKRGRPPGRIQNTQLQMRASPEFLKSIDDWREKQPDSPPRSEAVRLLVEFALATHKALAAAPKRKGK
jgi:hypothetical protein